MVGLAVSCIFMGKGWEGMGRDGMWLSWHSRCSVRVGVFRGGGGEVDVEKKRGLGGGGRDQIALYRSAKHLDYWGSWNIHTDTEMLANTGNLERII